MPAFKDLTGQKFGRLTAISPVRKRSPYRMKAVTFWLCACECGQQTEVGIGQLRNGNTRSCGCLNVDSRVRHRMMKTKEYRSWIAMTQRCTNPKSSKYGDYGGRGITIDEAFKTFQGFYAYMGPRPSLAHTLDRYPDNDGNYEPGNVRWATKKEQGRNTRVNRLITHNGETKCIAEWAEIVGVPPLRISRRILRGWPIELAFSQNQYHNSKELKAVLARAASAN